MAFWGGFNANQILDRLDYDLTTRHPKIFIGYSDVTALLTAITVKTGLVTFSGPGVISFAKPEPFPYTWEYFEKMCITPVDILTVESSLEYADDLYFTRKDDDHRILLKNFGMKVWQDGKADGQIVVGNLQTLLLLVGTAYAADMSGKILFIEEDETSSVAIVDRFMCQAHQLGWFDKITGLVVGRFTAHSGFREEDSFSDILSAYIPRGKYPVITDVDFGHSDPLITIPYGGIAHIDTKGNLLSIDKAVI